MTIRIDNDIATIAEDQFIGKWVRQTGRLDHDRWLLDKIKPRVGGGVCLDIGAYIGDHTIAYARWFDTVVAFEPCTEAFQCLKHNVAAAGNVICVNAALATHAGYGFMRNDAANPGANKVSQHGDIPVTFINAEIFDFTALTYIKIDVEGAECNVLRSLVGQIVKHKPKLLIEQRACDGNERAVEMFLNDLGYRYEPIQGKKGEQYDLWCE